MNNRHLPAGQAMDSGGGAAAMSPGAGSTGAVAGGPGPSPGPRRAGRPPSYHNPHPHQQQHYNGGHHQQQPHYHPQHISMPVYQNYMNAYSGYGYPMGAPIPPPYPNGQPYQPGGMPPQAYMYAPQHHARSPPAMHPQYVQNQMMGAGAMQPQHQPQPQPPSHAQHPSYPRNQQQSPIVVSTPYQTPPHSARSMSHNHAPVVQSAPHPPSQQVSTPSAQLPTRPFPQPSPNEPAPAIVPQPSAETSSAPPPSQSPSSSLSAQAAAPARPVTPPTPQTVDTPVEQPASPKQQPLVKLTAPKSPFRPPLPWVYPENEPFPRSTKTKRRRKQFDHEAADTLKLPAKSEPVADSATSDVSASNTASESVAVPVADQATPQTKEPSSTPALQDQSEVGSTAPATPNSVKATPATTASGPATPAKAAKPTGRAAVPAIPAVPVLPKASPKQEAPAAGTAGAEKPQTDNKENVAPQSSAPEGSKAASTVGNDEAPAAPVEVKPKPPAMPGAPGAPSLWTGLFSKAASAAAATSAPSAGQAGADGSAGSEAASGASGGAAGSSGYAQSNIHSLAEALRTFRVGNGEKIPFIEPRGLINSGNMCYMNSILQVLIFCLPFFDFLHQSGNKVGHRFNSETPLIDAMIEFMRDFKIIDSAVSVDQLRRRLKNEELEQYGEPFTPEFVYEAIKKLPRFATMRRGHQQDAEEFLGFLLESLHDECAQVMRASPASNTSTAANSAVPTPTASVYSANLENSDSKNDWLEVGTRQRKATTRSSGHTDTPSPITKIFGGQLRSELRVPGLKDSVTLEPYQPLQLDIAPPHVRNIVDALCGLTKPETIHGDFNPSRGKGVPASKQVFIESLPPVLILHLKRFQFDAEGNGTVKIWKKIGYPLELEIPRDVYTRSKRNSTATMPKYRLTAVVYHHGKNASGGHYTADVRRQDDHEWIRIDDTVIRRIRSDDVAEGGSEEDAPRGSASSDHARKEHSPAAAANRFAGMGDDAGDEDGWKQVSAPAAGSAGAGAKRWSSVVNGTSAAPKSNGSKSSHAKDNIKDNKVAYLLFYQRV